jgi:Cd2+/Zn2+-exporting ATPase
MSVQPQPSRFHLKNLDCANCAAKIENSLQHVDGVNEAVVDFATLTLHVIARDMDRVVQTVQEIEPHIEITPIDATSSPNAGGANQIASGLKKEMVLLGAALILFAGHLVYQTKLFTNTRVEVVLTLVISAYLLAGWNVLRGALATLRRRFFFDENVLMVIATAGALAIQAYSEAIAVMIFYKIGEILQESAVNRSRRSVKALLASKPDRAVKLTPEGQVEVAPDQVAVGDTIAVRPGEKIPLDGEVIAGRSMVDTAALTGESVPRSVATGETVMAGHICTTGALTIRVTRPFVESSIARVMDMVENATARKATTEKFITTFARYYTPVVVGIAALIALVPPLVGGAAFEPWIYRALVILVISCPCALVVSIPLGYFGGIGRASREGILVKGSNFIDALAAVKSIVFDKTGTLTEGVFKVNEVVSVNGFSKARLLELATAAETDSNHPIAASIRTAYQALEGTIDPTSVSGHIELSGQGVSAHYDGHTIMVGNDRMLHDKQIPHKQCEFDSTVAHVSVDGCYAGYLLIGDQLRADARSAVDTLRKLGVAHVSMLTGDNRCSAQAVSRTLGLDGFHADLLPEDKVRTFETISDNVAAPYKAAFVGDGINDAPVIARADVGMAMGGIGSDAAVESADVVLMGDSPQKTAQAIAIARRTKRIVWQNIILAFSIKGIFIGFGALGLASMWEAVFADMGTALAAVANSTRILKMKIP